MNNIDTLFINKIKDNCNNNISFIDEVASVLDISYDAAYRRITNKTTLSLQDAIKLGTHFNVSLDSLFEKNLQEKNKMIVSVSNEITDLKKLENYFHVATKTISKLQLKDDAHIIYNAKDLPLFYFLNDDLFAAFKIYTIMYLSNKSFPLKNISFEDFKFPISIINSAKQLSKFYQNINITEIWNNNILDMTLNQIIYFYELKLLSYKAAIKLCDKLTVMLKEVEKASFNGYRYKNKNTYFKLYFTELLPLNNNIIIKSSNKKVLFSPYSYLKYYFVENRTFIDEFETFINEHLQFSTLLSKTSVKERILFFKPKYNSIEKTKHRIELLKQFPIR